MSTSIHSGVEPYLFFDGKCEEAIEYYRKTIGAELDYMMRFKESPSQECLPPESGEKICHASLRISGSRVMLSDGRCQNHPKFEGFALSLAAPTEAEGQRLFDALAAQGQVQVPFAKTFFSAGFGMVIDKFGVTWMVMVSHQ